MEPTKMRIGLGNRAIAQTLSDLLESGRKLSEYSAWLEWTARTHPSLGDVHGVTPFFRETRRRIYLW